ncbi:FliM/FliN family flagellar motor C-terminal domain-containing protein [Thalassococcus sp. BH17M4-6]|uniref:FliM/FliN family flagellar motor C-terminal domain-containing protein n=1 Tax=Thalassococcus sp. BH17M4-6 TaxID=3413148 RepID=UPI003BDFA01A
MGNTARHDVLGQKASASRRAFEARTMSTAKALRRAVSRTADVLWDLALVVQTVRQEMLDQDGCLTALGADDLIIVLDGPDGAVGLVSVDRSLMTGLIEVQTISQVTTMPVDDRPLTATDAAMMAPLIDGTLQRFEENLKGNPLLSQLSGFRFGALVEDARTAGLMLEAAEYRAFRVSADLANGRRHGVLQIILPERAATPTVAEEDATDTPGKHADRLMLVPAQVEAVLCRLRLPLNQISGLKPGDLVPLPGDALDKAELIAGGGHRVARGRLGQMNGLRALRLTLPQIPRPAPSPETEDDTPPRAALPEPAVPDPAPAPPPPEPEDEDVPDLPPLDFDGADDDFGLGDFDAGVLEDSSG